MHLVARSSFALLLAAAQPLAAQQGAQPAPVPQAAQSGGMDPLLDVRCYVALFMATQRGGRSSAGPEPMRSALTFFEGRVTARHDAQALGAALRAVEPSLRRPDNVQATAVSCMQYHQVSRLIIAEAAQNAAAADRASD